MTIYILEKSKTYKKSTKKVINVETFVKRRVSTLNKIENWNMNKLIKQHYFKYPQKLNMFC